jgi:PhnB protein
MIKTASINPYLNFNGRCEEAIEFYKKAIGLKVDMLMHFKDAPDKSMMTPGTENKVMHASLSLGDTKVMASDGRCDEKGGGFQGFHLSYNAPDPAAAEKAFKALSAGGQVHMPLEKTFFSPSFGMLMDKFGLMWMVYVPAPMN